MSKAAAGTTGFLLGAVVGWGCVLIVCEMIWAYRERIWPPTGEDLEYFGVMIHLFLAKCVGGLMAAVAGGALGCWLAVRESGDHPPG
jgi:hypothetical protein